MNTSDLSGETPKVLDHVTPETNAWNILALSIARDKPRIYRIPPEFRRDHEQEEDERQFREENIRAFYLL
jgi:hypothetical protein